MKEKRAKVLLVDDSPQVLEQQKAVLGKTGVDIITAHTGPEAIKKIHIEQPDVIFLDLMLPEMNGDEVCRFIKKDPRLKNIPVIIVTAREEEQTMQRCFRCGCDAFVKKPFTAQELLEKLKVVLDEKEIFLDWDKLTVGS